MTEPANTTVVQFPEPDPQCPHTNIKMSEPVEYRHLHYVAASCAACLKVVYVPYELLRQLARDSSAEALLEMAQRALSGERLAWPQ